MLSFMRIVVIALAGGSVGLLTLGLAQADEPAPLISKLSAPREVTFGEDATFAATVAAEVTGTVRFSLKTYAVQTVWTKTASITEGQASVVLTSGEAAGLEKGSRVLVGTVNGRTSRSAYAPVRLRGRIFRDVTVAPAEIKPGDEIIITDMSLLQPQNVISQRSEKGKWWRRGYTIPEETDEHSLVCVEEQDMEDPESCLAPQFTLSLNLEGWYEVWVRTLRRETDGDVGVGGGIDVRFSGEKYFVYCNPLDVNTGTDHPPYGALVDILYRAADLTGQDLVFQQPFGTYASSTKLCDASLAGVRLVKLSDEQVAQLQAERARQDTKIAGYDDDGFSYFYAYATHTPDFIARMIEPLRDQSVAFLNFELGGLGGITIPTPYTGLYQMSARRDGDLRANAFFQWCYDNDINILRTLTDYGHEVGVNVFASMMMERSFSRDETMRAHPEWQVQRGPGTWDYAIPEVRDYQVEKIAWIIENYDIDGFIVDYTRYGRYFNEDEPDKFEHMNDFARKLRMAVDEVNAGRDHKCLLCASFGDRSWHVTHWGSGKLEDQGLDVETWLEEGVFDIIMPEGPTVLDFVEMAKDSRTAVWPRKDHGVSFETHTKTQGQLGPKGLERGVKYWLDNGAPGVFFFNHAVWIMGNSLRRVGFTEELELRTKVDEVYGYREGPVVDFATWYPTIEETDAQRKTLKPLTIAPAAEGEVDGELIVPVRNSFDHPVVAVVGWAHPEDEKAQQWTITPPTDFLALAAGEEGELHFQLKGSAPTYKAVPRVEVELRTDEQVVFRHRLPLRAVPQLTCTRVTSPPQIDGDLGDEAWASIGGLQPLSLFLVGQPGNPRGETKMAMAYDEENLYLAYECTEMNISQVAQEVYERDSGEIYKSDNIQILLDREGTEQAYLGFVATPAGAQSDYRAYIHNNQFTQQRDWQADWLAATTWQEDGYCLELAIPFAALGGAPNAGEVWRWNLVAAVRAEDGKLISASWSSAEEPFHLPRDNGTLYGALAFE